MKTTQSKKHFSLAPLVVASVAIGVVAGIWYLGWFTLSAPTISTIIIPTQLAQNAPQQTVSPTTTAAPLITDVVDELSSLLSTSSLKIIPPALHELPGDINPNQLATYYRLGNSYDLVLVQRPSANIVLEDVPQTFDPKFTGVLYAKTTDTAWSRLVLIPAMPNRFNNGRPNPYHLWISDGKLYLSVVDTEGAGSGEGNESVWRLDSGEWSQISCVYYQVWGESTYLTNTKNFGVQGKQSASKCSGHSVLVPLAEN